MPGTRGSPVCSSRFPLAAPQGFPWLFPKIPLTVPKAPPSAEDLPSRHWPLKKTFCSSRNFSSFSEEEKFSSLDTALHFRIFFGTRAGGGAREE